MSTAKADVKALLDKLPEDCTLEDVQYHLYVVEKIRTAEQRAALEGTRSQEDVEKEFNEWIAR
ncbi:MAG: hypothetical protein RLZ44_975 [Pseudomonadota bacterium]